MLALIYFVTAVVIGIAATASALATRRKFPGQLPPFNQDQVSQDQPADVGENPIRDERSFSERLGKIRFITSTYYLINKRH